MSAVNFNELLDWLTAELSKGITKKNQEIIRLWGTSRDHVGTSPDEWKAWVSKCCKDARKPKVIDRVAVLYANLRDGSPNDLAGPAEAPARSISNQSPSEYAEFKERAVRARTERPEPLPSSVAVTRLARTCGGYVKALAIVTKEWERQGRPYPEDFDPAPITQG
mgnify:CR=1 FL=1